MCKTIHILSRYICISCTVNVVFDCLTWYYMCRVLEFFSGVVLGCQIDEIMVLCDFFYRKPSKGE